MGDQTCVQLIVYACPPDQTRAIRQQIDNYDLTEHEQRCISAPGQVHSRWENLPEDQIMLNHLYLGTSVPCGSADDIGAALAEEAPGAIWEVWEDPKYEWLGDLRRYAPSLGLFKAECGSDGQPLFTATELRDLLAKVRRGDDIARDLGDPWEQLIAEMSGEMPEDISLPVPEED